MTRSIALTPARATLAAASLLLVGAVGASALGTLPAANAVGAASGATSAADPTAAFVPDGADIALAANTTPKAAGPARLAGLLGLLRRTDRAEISVRTANGEKVILYVRGTVSAVSASSISIALHDGSTQVFAIDGSTKVRAAGKASTVPELAAGDRAMVFGLRNADGTWTARLIRCVRPAPGSNGAAPKASAGPDRSGAPASGTSAG